jgi:hypothetical protein
MNAAITAHRKVAFSSISLDDVKRLKNHVGTTVNDVVLAVCTGALRNYLQSRDELPESPLVATVPVAVQDATGMQGSNRISAMFVNLPTQIEDPLERLKAINSGTKGAKEEHSALGADVLLNWVEHATPTVFAAAARTYSRLKLADRHRPIHNLIVSNVPGPDFPLYFSGAELVAGFPLGPIMEGAGLNITVMSYRGVLNWGLMACRETVAGAGEIADSIPAALDELLAAAGLGKGDPVGIAPAHSAEGVATTKSKKDTGSKSASKKSTAQTSTAQKSAVQKKTAEVTTAAGEAIDKAAPAKKVPTKARAEKKPAASARPEVSEEAIVVSSWTTPAGESQPQTADTPVGVSPDPVEQPVGGHTPSKHHGQATSEPISRPVTGEASSEARQVAETAQVAETTQPRETEAIKEPESASITRRASESELIAELLDEPSPAVVSQSADRGSSESGDRSAESSNGSGLRPT